MNHLRNFRQEKERPTKRKLFSRRRRCQCEEDSVIAPEEKPSFLGRIFSANGSCKRKKKLENPENSTTLQLRRLLRMDFRITIWDINSNILAMQLTLIDRDLFARIPAEEIEILVFQRSSRNAPNLAAWIAFSHRVSCLIASEILSIKRLAMRSRIIARLINAARKCFAMGNFHSCRSILSGLQVPPIFRLRNTWDYLRVHHANRYWYLVRFVIEEFTHIPLIVLDDLDTKSWKGSARFTKARVLWGIGALGPKLKGVPLVYRTWPTFCSGFCA